MKDSTFDDLTGVKLRRGPRWLTFLFSPFFKDAKEFYGVDEFSRPNREKYRSDPIYTLTSPGAAYSQMIGKQQDGLEPHNRDENKGLALTRLESLPREILGLIAEALDNVSKICLATTRTTMLKMLALNTSALSTCERWLLMCRFEKDCAVRNYTTYWCCFCKKKHPRDQFVASQRTQ